MMNLKISDCFDEIQDETFLDLLPLEYDPEISTSHVKELTMSKLHSKTNQTTRKNWLKLSRIGIAAAVAAALVTVSTAAVFGWPEQILQRFQASPETQQQFVQQGIASAAGEAVTDSGITIQPLQVLQDDKIFFALFQVTSDSFDLSPALDMDLTFDFQGNNLEYMPFDAMSTGFTDDGTSHTRYFEIAGSKSDHVQIEEMSVTFHGILDNPGAAIQGEYLLNGNWEFQLPIRSVEPLVYSLNQTIEVEGVSLRMTSVTVSALYTKLSVHPDDAHSLEQAIGVNLDQADSLTPLRVSALRLKDGTILNQTNSWTVLEGFGTGDYIQCNKLSNVVSPEQVAGLILDCGAEISLS